jgi:hypothetical protein
MKFVLILIILLLQSCTSSWIIIGFNRNQSITGWCTDDTITAMMNIKGNKYKVECGKIGKIGDTIQFSNTKD